MNNFYRTKEIKNIYDKYELEFNEEDAVTFSELGESDTDNFFNALGEQISDPTTCLDSCFDDDPF